MKYPKILHLWYSDKTQAIYSSESSFSIKDNESLDEVIDFINLLSSADFTTTNIEQIFNILEDIDTALRIDLGGGELLIFSFWGTDETERNEAFKISKRIIDHYLIN